MDAKRRRRHLERLNALDPGITEANRKAERQAAIDRILVDVPGMRKVALKSLDELC